MKSLLQRFTRWHNMRAKRRGNLWEETFKSVMVEDGLASKMMAAYIDSHPVRIVMVADPGEYRWSSYGEAMVATGRSGAKAKAGLVRAVMADKGWEADARHWAGRVAREYRMLLLEEGEEKTLEVVNADGERVTEVVRKGMKRRRTLEEEETGGLKSALRLAAMLWRKVRHFSDGAVIGCRAFVDGLFEQCRERFGAKRKSGARKMRGRAAEAVDMLTICSKATARWGVSCDSARHTSAARRPTFPEWRSRNKTKQSRFKNPSRLTAFDHPKGLRVGLDPLGPSRCDLGLKPHPQRSI